MAAEPQTRCPRCGTPAEPLQEYCLECGLRLRTPGLVPALASGWQRRVRWYPGDWIWPSLLALVVAVVAASGAILWTREAESAPPETLVGDTSALPTVTETQATAPTGTTPTVPTAPTRTTSTTPQPQRTRTLTAWPQGRSGWTLVVASLPASAGRKAAVAKARQALGAGLTQVGVLDSSEYSSLHPGYFVVFSGNYASLSEAQDAASRAAQKGYGNVYARRITS
jgi:SPOR domain